MPIDRSIDRTKVAFRFDINSGESLAGVIDPILQEYGIKAMCAVQSQYGTYWSGNQWNSTLLGSSRFAGADGPDNLSAATLKQLHDSGRWEVASHSATHSWCHIEPEVDAVVNPNDPPLTYYISDEAKRTAYVALDAVEKSGVAETPCATWEALVNETAQSKADIEAIIGAGECRGFVVPYNNGSQELYAALYEAGYEWASSFGAAQRRGAVQASMPRSMPAFERTSFKDYLTHVPPGGKFDSPFRIPTQYGDLEEIDGSLTKRDFATDIKPWLEQHLRGQIYGEGSHRICTLTMHAVWPDGHPRTILPADGGTASFYNSSVSYLRQLIEWLLDNNIEIVTGSELAQAVRFPGRYVTERHDINLIPNGHLRHVRSAGAAANPVIPDNFFATEADWAAKKQNFDYFAPTDAGAPVSSWDGQPCGYLKVLGADYSTVWAPFHQFFVRRGGWHKLRFKAKLGDTTTRNLVVELQAHGVAGEWINRPAMWTKTLSRTTDLTADWKEFEYDVYLSDFVKRVGILCKLNAMDTTKGHYISDFQLERVRL